MLILSFNQLYTWVRTVRVFSGLPEFAHRPILLLIPSKLKCYIGNLQQLSIFILSPEFNTFPVIIGRRILKVADTWDCCIYFATVRFPYHLQHQRANSPRKCNEEDHRFVKIPVTWNILRILGLRQEWIETCAFPGSFGYATDVGTHIPKITCFRALRHEVHVFSVENSDIFHDSVFIEMSFHISMLGLIVCRVSLRGIPNRARVCGTMDRKQLQRLRYPRNKVTNRRRSSSPPPKGEEIRNGLLLTSNRKKLCVHFHLRN